MSAHETSTRESSEREVSTRDARLITLIERLRDEVRDALAGHTEALALLLAASELCIERDTPLDASAPHDAETLRLTSAHSVLQILGVNDASIEACKMQLACGRDLDSLNWRN